MKKLLLAATLLASLSTSQAATFPANTTPAWKSYLATGNTADIVSSPTVAAAIGTKVDATSGQSLSQQLQSPTITGGTLSGSVGSSIVATSSTGATSRNLASHFSDVTNVLDFGAKCDGTTDDTAAFNAATAAARVSASHSVYISSNSCLISGVVNLPNSVWLHGSGASGGALLFGNSSQILFSGGSASAWQGATLSDLYILVSGVTSAQTFPIDMAKNQPAYSQIRNVQIEGGTYNGIDMSGNNVTVDNVMMQGVKGIGIRVGYGSTGGNNTDPKILNTTIAGDYMAGSSTTSAAILTQILDAGGLTLQNNDMVGGLIGTQIFPGANQTVFHLFASNTVLSDSAQEFGLEIDTSASTSVANDMKFEGSWTANAQVKDVSVFNNGGGSVQSLLFIGHRYYLANGDAFHAGPNVSNVTITASQFCGNNPNGTAVYVENGDNGFNITNNRIPAVCAGEGTGNSGTGVTLAGNNNNTVVTGNDLNGLSVGINFPGGSGLTDYITDNIGANNTSSAISTASLTTLPNQVHDFVTLSSANGDTILDLEGMWLGRKVYLYNSTTSSIAFGTGTNICNAYTLPASGTFEAIYTPNSCWYLH